MFGYTAITIDSKGRLAIPAKFRDQLLFQNEESIAVTRDPQYPALKIYPGSIWNEISQELQSLQGLDPIVRNLQWTILGNASVSSFDPSGRMLILLPSSLRDYAEINSSEKISFIGMGNKFEVWNENNWQMRQTGGALSTEILEVVLPESLKTISF
jgi:MraZ protein